MKKVILILSTMGLMSCSAYKIQVVNFADHDYYVPMERRGLDWEKQSVLYFTEQGARQHVETLRERAKLRRIYRKKRFIKIK
jgi:hypothetical protein